jgi:hypothetical protein
MAFGRAERDASSTGIGLAGVTLGIAGVVAAATFLYGLDHLKRTPRLVGWNWDTAGYDAASEGSSGRSDLDAALRDAKSVERVGGLSVYATQGISLADLKGEAFPMAFATGGHAIEPTVTKGRAPKAADEVLLHRHLADALGADVGDAVTLRGVDARGATVEREFELVGLGVVPILDGRIDRGFAVTLDGLGTISPYSEADYALVNYAPGASSDDLDRELRASGIQFDAPFGVDRPKTADIAQLDLERAGQAPWILAILVGVMAAGVLMHLVLTASRAFRRDLAMHRALGFVRRQLVGASMTHAVALVGIALVLAVPIGIIAGRALWLTYARGLGVAPETAISWTSLGELVMGVAALAALTALPIALRLSRMQCAPVLRAE